MPRLLVLTAHPELATPSRLLALASELGLEVELRVPPVLANPRLELLRATHGGADVEFSARGALLLARPGAFSLVAILREHRRLVVAGARPLQRRRALVDACDQWRTLELARRAGLAAPRTLLVRRPADLSRALDSVPGPPWFLKGRRGSKGTQVELALERGSALRVGHLFWGSGTSFLVQEDLRASGRVERHLVVRGRVVASAVATPARGEHRSNFALGGRFESIDPRTSRAAELARRAVAAIGLPLAAVDTIGEREPRLLEVNASPGFEGLSAAVGRDLLREAVVELLAGAGRAGSAVAAAAPSRA